MNIMPRSDLTAARGIMRGCMIGLAFWLTLFASCAHAQTVERRATISWTPPTTCTDNTQITACAITGYRVEKQSGATWTDIGTTAPNVLQFVETGLGLGVHTYRVLALSVNGPSAPSPSGSKSISVPNAPGTVVVTITVTVTP